MVVDNVEFMSITENMFGVHQQRQQWLILYPLRQMEHQQSVIDGVVATVASLLLLLLVGRKCNVKSLLVRRHYY